MSRPLTIKRHRSQSFKLNNISITSALKKSVKQNQNLSVGKNRYQNNIDYQSKQNKVQINPINIGKKSFEKKQSNKMQLKFKQSGCHAYRLRKSSCLKKPIQEQIQSFSRYQITMPMMPYQLKTQQTKATKQTKDNDTSNEIGLEQIFYSQVRFFQMCKKKIKIIK